jgi:hypothetical protein
MLRTNTLHSEGSPGWSSKMTAPRRTRVRGSLRFSRIGPDIHRLCSRGIAVLLSPYSAANYHQIGGRAAY